jgi:hypothetical protein
MEGVNPQALLNMIYRIDLFITPFAATALQYDNANHERLWCK